MQIELRRRYYVTGTDEYIQAGFTAAVVDVETKAASPREVSAVAFDNGVTIRGTFSEVCLGPEECSEPDGEPGWHLQYIPDEVEGSAGPS